MTTEKLPGGGARATARIVDTTATLGLEGPGQALIDDGPAQGCRFWSVRLPEFLRVVHVPGQRPYRGGHEFDCLDKLDDELRRGEMILVYRQRTWAHYRGGGFVAAYVYVPTGPGTLAAIARSNDAWRLHVDHELAKLPPLDRGEPPLPAFACRR